MQKLQQECLSLELRHENSVLTAFPLIKGNHYFDFYSTVFLSLLCIMLHIYVSQLFRLVLSPFFDLCKLNQTVYKTASTSCLPYSTFLKDIST